MSIYSVIFLVLYLTGVFLLLNMSKSFDKDMKGIINPNKSIKQKVLAVQKKKSGNPIINALKNTMATLDYMGKSHLFMIVFFSSVIMSIIGVIAAFTILDNKWLAPALFVAFLTLPFIAVRLWSYSYANHVQSELELALSQVTTSYMRTNDIVASVEENIKDMNFPVKDAFQEFVDQVHLVNPNERQALDDLKEKIDNNIFGEWCEGVKKCLQNRTLKYMLIPIVNKFSTLRSIANSVAMELNGIKIEFFSVAAIVFANYPLLKFISADWYDVLAKTEAGHATTGFIALVFVICTIILIYITKPLKYDI